MAYTAGNLHLRAGAPADLFYTYDAGSDSMATVAVSGYFNNVDDDLGLVADDIIFAQCNDGNFWLRVSAVSSGTVTTQPMAFDGPWNGVIDTATGTVALSVGITELGTGTGTAFTLPTPYAGAKVVILQVGTLARTITTDATAVTINSTGNTIITYSVDEGETTTFLGISTTRWVLTQNSADAVLS